MTTGQNRSTLPTDMTSPITTKKAIAETGRQLYDRGLVAGTDGNISVRMDDDRIMITPAGLAKGRLAAEDMVIIDGNGKHLQGRLGASSELLMHLFLYRNRPDVAACIHSHPPYATAFAVAGVTISEDVLPEVVVSIGKIPLTDYAPPGTEAVPKSLEPHVETCNAFLLRNHGLVTVGRSLDEAFHRHELVEHYAQILFLASRLGDVERIPSQDFQRLEKMRCRLDETTDAKG
ncbi:MAG: class II aldolase/adducin family protein [bacterium]